MNEQHPENKLIIHNSTAEFLIFTQQAGEGGIEVRYEDGSIWLTQKLMAELFNVDVRTISEHLKNIYASGELQEDSVIRKFRITASDGKNYNTLCYNLDAIISVGYRVNSTRATQFRQWATKVLKEFAIKGFVLDRIHDGGGLYFRVRPSGAKSWLFSFSLPGNRQLFRMPIGTLKDVSLREARNKVIELRKLVTEGIDPYMDPARFCNR